MSRVICQRHAGERVLMAHVPSSGAKGLGSMVPAVYRCPECGREVLSSNVAAGENALRERIVTFVMPSGTLRSTIDTNP